MRLFIASLFVLMLPLACNQKFSHLPDEDPPATDHIVLGIDNFVQNYSHLVQGKRVGLMTNSSGVNGKLRLTSDLLFSAKNVNLTVLFSPEHGIRGSVYAGLKVKDAIDSRTSLPVYSLYGSQPKPSAEALKNIDVLVVDIQDIGLRAYTYIYTMAMIMEAASESDKQVIVLDRPNPINGIDIEGNLVEEEFYSIVGLYSIPYRHGMTIGELALLFNTEFGINCSLKVIPMKNWQRRMFWNETGLDWIPTSPHVPHWQTILYMIASGTLGELHVLSNGVGYTSPFELIGAPWINSEEFADSLNKLNLPGVHFRPLIFKPYYSLYKGDICQGVQLHIKDNHQFKPYTTGLHIIQTHIKLYPEQNLFADETRVNMFDKVMGTDKIRKKLTGGMPMTELKQSWQEELNQFKQKRKKYLIYN